MRIQSLKSDVIKKLRSDVTFADVAHCVEELVWNSIDAGAQCVAVRLNLPFFKIQVIDNGNGIPFDQIDMVGKRYATNKCHTLDDLNNLQYCGFRGEALASLKEVSSKLMIESRASGCSETYCKIFNHGKALRSSISRNPRPSKGTTVTVFDFMYNRPVRKKTISEALDLEETRKILQSVALIHPGISFSLQSEATGEMCLTFKKCSSVSCAFIQLFGKEKSETLQRVENELEDYRINGYISRTSFSTKDYQFLYVNKHIIFRTSLHKLINEVLNKALSTKFQSRSKSPTKSQSLFCGFVLNILCPRSEYDVIFDHKRTMIEFSDWDKVQRLVTDTMCNFLKAEGLISISVQVVEISPKEAFMLPNEGMFLNLGVDNFKNGLFSNAARRPSNSPQLQVEAPFTENKSLDENGQHLEMAENCSISINDSSNTNLGKGTKLNYKDLHQNINNLVNKDFICLRKATASHSILDSLKVTNTTSCLNNSLPLTKSKTPLSAELDIPCRSAFPTLNPVMLRIPVDSALSELKKKSCPSKFLLNLKEKYKFNPQKNKKFLSLVNNPKIQAKPYDSVSKSIKNVTLTTKTACQVSNKYNSKSNITVITHEKSIKCSSLNSFQSNIVTSKYSFCEKSHLSLLKHTLSKKENSQKQKQTKISEQLEEPHMEIEDPFNCRQNIHKFDYSTYNQNEDQMNLSDNYCNQNLCIDDLNYQQERLNHKVSANHKTSNDASHLSRANHSLLFLPTFTTCDNSRNHHIDAHVNGITTQRKFLNLHKLSLLQKDVEDNSNDKHATFQDKLGTCTQFMLPQTFAPSKGSHSILKTSKWEKNKCSSKSSYSVIASQRKQAKHKRTLTNQCINADKSPFWLPEMVEVWKANQNFSYSEDPSQILPSSISQDEISLYIKEPISDHVSHYVPEQLCFSTHDDSPNISPQTHKSHESRGSGSNLPCSSPNLIYSELRTILPSNPTSSRNSSISSITDVYDPDFVLKSAKNEVNESISYPNQSEINDNVLHTLSTITSSLKTAPLNKIKESNELQSILNIPKGTNQENSSRITEAIEYIESMPTPLFSDKLLTYENTVDGNKSASNPFFMNDAKYICPSFKEDSHPSEQSFQDFMLRNRINSNESLNAPDILSNEPSRLLDQDVPSPKISLLKNEKAEIEMECCDDQPVDVGPNMVQTEDNGSARWIFKVDERTKRVAYIDSITGNSTYSVPKLLQQSDVNVTANQKPFVAPRRTHFFLTHDFSPFLSNSSKSDNNDSICDLQIDLNSHLEKNEVKDWHHKWRYPKPDDVKDMFSKWENPMFDVAPKENSIEGPKIPVCLPHMYILNSYRFNSSSLNSLKVIGQVDCKFITCVIQDFDGSNKGKKLLALFDQHAVHERIRIEELTEDIYKVEEDGKKTVRSLEITPPLSIVLELEDIRLLRTYHTSLQDIGIYLTLQEDSNEVEVLRLPVCFVKEDTNQLRKKVSDAKPYIEKMIKEWIQSLMQSRSVSSILPKTLSAVLNSQACRGAVKFGDILTLSDCKHLMASLSECKLPFQCAHGRPSIAPILDLNKIESLSKQKPPPSLWKLSKWKAV